MLNDQHIKPSPKHLTQQFPRQLVHSLTKLHQGTILLENVPNRSTQRQAQTLAMPTHIHPIMDLPIMFTPIQSSHILTTNNVMSLNRHLKHQPHRNQVLHRTILNETFDKLTFVINHH